MAFIYNIKTKVLTECLNKDVIKVCKKDPLHYLVAENLSKINTDIQASIQHSKLDIQEANNEEKKVSLSKMKLEDLKQLANKLGLESDGLNCDELRKIIRDAQGK